MQSTLRSAARRAVGVSSRHGVATTSTTTKAAAAGVPERDLVAENEKAWVAALVHREVRAQMAAEEERRVTRDCLRAAEEEWAEWRARRRRLADDVELIPFRAAFYTLAAVEGSVIGAWLAFLLFAR